MSRFSGYDVFVRIEGGTRHGDLIWLTHTSDFLNYEISKSQIITELEMTGQPADVVAQVRKHNYRLVFEPTWVGDQPRTTRSVLLPVEEVDDDEELDDDEDIPFVTLEDLADLDSFEGDEG